jgi:hypothetical protein
VGDGTLTGSKYLWLYAEENLPAKHQERFAPLKAGHLHTTRAWAIKESLRDLWGSPVRDHASFGLLYKGHTAAAFVKDTLFPALGGFAFGSVAVGYLTWAQQIAVGPLALTNVVSRVSYPALAQLQHDREAFGEMVATTLNARSSQVSSGIW